MATLASSPRVADNRNREPGLLAEIRAFWRLFFVKAFNPLAKRFGRRTWTADQY